MTNPPAADEPAATAAEGRAAPSFTADFLSAEEAARLGTNPPPAAGAADVAPDESPTADAPTAAEPVAETRDLGASSDDLPAADAPTANVPPADVPPSAAPPGAAPPGSTPPPSGGTPPPSGGTPPPGAPPPPPGGGFPPPFGNPFGGPGFNRAGLVRPQQGRYVAGVCAAIGRATNTDPTLWRVIFAVLTLAGGVSIVAYLAGWLLLPAEGDTASPLEALLGRGRSSTSSPLAIVIGISAVLAFVLVMSRNIGAAMVGLAIVIGVVALLARGQGGSGHHPAAAGPFTPPPTPPPTPYPPSGPPFTAPTMQFTPPAAGPPPATPVPPAPPAPPGPHAPPASGASAAETAEFPAAPATAGYGDTAPVTAPRPPTFNPPAPPRVGPTLPPLPPLPPLPATPGYRQPFAPHGPFSSRSPYAASLGYPPPGVPNSPYPGLAPLPPKPPKPPKEKSKLGRITFSLICLSLGVLAVLEVSVADFKVSTFFAVPLAIVALGLVTGAWLGRARVLILLGALLSIALAISTASTSGPHVPRSVADINLRPTEVSQLDDSYVTDLGNIRADLSALDFTTTATTGQPVDLSLRVKYGNLQVILPPNVDVTVDVRVSGGDCKVFGQDCGGFNQTKEFANAGLDGAGGGKLHLDLSLDYGNLEVTR
ncbi:PspC domain-containing protein [Dactylosporangium sucinum]|uniref:Phage shock protein PspC N-terminal domain-containing protein n=1 Tax=Dactylosporangium sucinum TaxID=1424081 RepID=A0A917TEB4_9ACTN|nr:PspC domain-containing protein [Dactylosporangium sucinum]GGM17493.1 hypothetical protein GCM10007977_018400 [Dactylosporangium sucinum]